MTHIHSMGTIGTVPTVTRWTSWTDGLRRQCDLPRSPQRRRRWRLLLRRRRRRTDGSRARRDLCARIKSTVVMLVIYVAFWLCDYNLYVCPALRNETCFWFIFRYYINASARTRIYLRAGRWRARTAGAAGQLRRAAGRRIDTRVLYVGTRKRGCLSPSPGFASEKIPSALFPFNSFFGFVFMTFEFCYNYYCYYFFYSCTAGAE